MARIVLLLPALALGLHLGAQPGAQGAPAKASPGSVATPVQTLAPVADDMLLARATPYQPTLLRDPFSAPTDAEQTNKGDLVDDIGVKGIVVANGKMYAVVTDARGLNRTLPVGFKFRDGELTAISEKGITFHQWEMGTTNTRVFKTVVKTFKREEGKR